MSDARWMFLFTAVLIAGMILVVLSYVPNAMRLEVGLGTAVFIVAVGYLGERSCK